MIPERHLFKARAIEITNRLALSAGRVPASELFFQSMFQAAVAALKLDLPALYPLGGAANYSLLYALLRLLTETPVSRVLELGAGQSSLLMSAVGKKRGGLDIISVDGDSDWAERVGGRVAHPVLHAPLVDRKIHGVASPGFALPVALGAPFDMMLVDGPMGAKRRSRWAALEVLDDHLADEFVVVFDDAGRSGEQDTIREFAKSRPEAKTRFVNGLKSQCLLFTPRFGAAAYF